MSSTYQPIEPQIDALKPLIKLYYLHQSQDENGVEEITYFPNYTTTINIYQHSKVSATPYSRTHEKELSDTYLKLLVAKFDKSREIIMRGAYNKLTIVFNSLGLNHFLDIPLGKIAQDHFALFEHYGEDFEKIIQEIFNADHLEDKRDLLDAFFLSKLVGFQEERLSYAVQAIHTHGGDVSIQKIAKELGISRRTLLRLFHTHLALSPVEYKSIIKFRRALDIYQNQVEKTNISTLSYEANFYDQSDLNFHFKAKTGLSPKQLFSTIKTVNQDLYWKMERVPKFQDNQM